MEFHLKENGKNKHTLNFPVVPRQGDIISTTNLKNARYLVLRIEFFENHKTIILHVKKFPNEMAASLALNGYNNIRPF